MTPDERLAERKATAHILEAQADRARAALLAKHEALDSAAERQREKALAAEAALGKRRGWLSTTLRLLAAIATFAVIGGAIYFFYGLELTYWIVGALVLGGGIAWALSPHDRLHDS